MSFNDELSKIEVPTIAELYEFTAGTENRYYTSYLENLTFGLTTYEAVPVDRTAFTLHNEFQAISITVALPITDIIAQLIANAPILPVQIRIKRVSMNDLSDIIILFKGEVKNITLQNKVASVVCESTNEVFNTQLPKWVYQSYCNHVLYDGNCKADKNSFKVTDNVTLINNGQILRAAGFSTKPDDWFRSGHVIFGDDIRLITSHTGQDITLHVPFDNRLQDGASVDAYAGCNLSYDTCDTKFNNLVNFLGMATIPSRNPVIWGFR